MANKADPTAVKKALEQARAQRTQITRGALLPIDTAHIVGACANCGRLGFTVLGFPDPPYSGPQGQPRYRSARELERFLDTLRGDLEAAPKGPPQQVRLPSPEDKGASCACGAPADPRQVAGMRFMHAMPGSGAELIVEGSLSGGSLLLSASGQALGEDKFSWRMFRAPVDGMESEIASGFDDAAVIKAFGRPLTLAHSWLQLLSAARGGNESLEQVEPGYWIYAGPRESAALDAKIKEVVGDNAERGDYPLIELGRHAPMPAGPAWPQWAHEYAQSLAQSELRAGVVLDVGVVRKMITGQLDRLSIGWKLEQNGAIVVAEIGDARWPIEIAIVSLGAAHLGWTLAETAAAAVGEAAARVQALGQFFAALRKARPEIEFKVDGMRCTPVRKDGTQGRPINLMVTPFRVQPGTPAFDREVRFVCDEIPKGTDPTRTCPCGAKAFVAARLFPFAVVEEFRKATGDKQPAVIEQWPEETPKAALLATISCDLHVRIPGAHEIEEAGLKGDLLSRRLAEDLENSLFAVDVARHDDKAGKRALLAYGPLVASVVMNDHLVSALHNACRDPQGNLPLRAKQVEAQVITPNVLCMYEEGFDDDLLDQVLEAGAAMDGIPPGTDPPFSLTWDVSLTAAPVGRFQNLYPPPQEQGGPPQGPPGRGGPPQRRR